MRSIRLGTRGSLLALTQSGGVALALQRSSGWKVETEVIQTLGDRTLDRALPEIGGKGLFTEELDRALLEERIDLAVHSLKDLPTESVPGLTVACIPEREDPRDVLVGPAGRTTTLASLPGGSLVGTSSLRRRALLRAFRDDLRVESVRGNLDTRLRKLDGGAYAALILAAAGLKRLGFAERAGEWLERTSWIPAPGQGALAVVTRRKDAQLRSALAALHHPETASAVRAERAFLSRLGGGCQVPIGALGLPFQHRLRLWGLVASPDGKRLVKGDLTGTPEQAESLGERLGDLLLSRGARGILDELDERAPAPAPP